MWDSSRYLLWYSVALVLLAAARTQASSEESGEAMKSAVTRCIEETLIDMDTMAKVRAGRNDVEDPLLNKFAFCIISGLEMLKEGGKIDQDKLLGNTEEEQREDTKRILDKCLPGVEPITEENAWELFRCYREERPNEVMF